MTAPPSKDKPIWPGCAVCMWKRDEAGDDPMEAAPDEGVFATEDGGYHCSVCDGEVERKVDSVELITARWGPDASDTERVLLDRVVGYFPPGRDYPAEARKFADALWLENVCAILSHGQLLDEGGRPMMVGGERG